MKKKIIAVVTVIIALIVIALFGAAWHFSTQLAHPKPYVCQSDHFRYCGGISELGIPYEDVSFKNEEGHTLSGWYVPRAGSDKGIVMIHGVTADRREGLRWVKALHAGGYNLLLFDLRNHGKSDKAFTGMGYLERKDGIAAIDYMLNEKGLKKAGIFGVSMGASTGIQAMAEDVRVLAGVFEASFADVPDLLSEIGKRDFGLPRYPLIPLVMRVYGLRGGFDPSLINPVDHVGKISPRPVFIIHCRGDNYIEYRHGMRIYKAAGEPKVLWSAPCDMHARAWQSDPPTAEKKVVDFFRAYVK